MMFSLASCDANSLACVNPKLPEIVLKLAPTSALVASLLYCPLYRSKRSREKGHTARWVSALLTHLQRCDLCSSGDEAQNVNPSLSLKLLGSFQTMATPAWAVNQTADANCSSLPASNDCHIVCAPYRACHMIE